MKTFKFISAIVMMALVAGAAACKDSKKTSSDIDEDEEESPEIEIADNVEVAEAGDVSDLSELIIPGDTITIPTNDGETLTGIVEEAPSHLIYAIFDKGDNTEIDGATMTTVKYRGMHADGTVFDEGTADFSPSMVIPGFGEGLTMLGKGGKAILRIPGFLGYGTDGVPQAGIGPDETLYFLVEIVDIQK